VSCLSLSPSLTFVSLKATVEIIKRDEDGAFDLSSQFWSYFPPKKPFVYDPPAPLSRLRCRSLGV
jgi:hypothetical protein